MAARLLALLLGMSVILMLDGLAGDEPTADRCHLRGFAFRFVIPVH